LPPDAYSAPPDPIAAFKGPISKGREGRGGEGDGERKGREEEEGGKKGKGWGRHSISCLLVPQT